MSESLAIWLVRREAEGIAEQLLAEFGGVVYRPWLDDSRTQKEMFREVFRNHQTWILIMATGIAVRFIDGLTEDKKDDPAVVVLDEGCRYSIALLGGHEGGANNLAVDVANVFGAVPVITTATEAMKPLVVGIGCRKGVSAGRIEEAVQHALKLGGTDDTPLQFDAIRELVTIDLKRSESGLVEFSEKYAIPLRWLSREDVSAREWVSKPSAWVQSSVGLDGVCEPCALMASSRGKLLVPKTTLNGVAVAVVEDTRIDRSVQRPDSLFSTGNAGVPARILHSPKKGKLNLVSVGPGFAEHITPSAIQALTESEVIVGYELYLQWIKPWIEAKEIYSAPLTQERERAVRAIEFARLGRNVSLVSSGDIGVYAMAALVFEELEEQESFDIEVIPGITAASACSSLLGSPLSHDFATLSLSDLLCPWPWIEEKAKRLAQADMCIALYNVQSKKRQDGIYRILNIILEDKPPDTVCGVVRNAYRPEQSVKITTLQSLLDGQFDMFTTILVGNRYTVQKGSFMFTPRGYNGWADTEEPSAETPAYSVLTANPKAAVPHCDDRRLAQNAVWVFSGTSDGNELANTIAEAKMDVIVSVATEYGASIAGLNCQGVQIISGRPGLIERKRLLSERKAKCLVDATHPYAEQISKQLIAIADELNIPYIRYERPPCQIPSDLVVCDSLEEAATAAIKVGQRIFLTTGAKDLVKFTQAKNADGCVWFTRVLPDGDSLQSALEAGIPRDQICAMQGPFSQAFNEALWRDWKIDCVITKESGSIGGFEEKLAAARTLKMPLIVLRRPRVSYPSLVGTIGQVMEFINSSEHRHG